VTNLVELDITGNWDLGGNIPPEIENLTDLAYFSAGSTGLTGNIPAELGNMQNLKGLYLGSASFTGGIPPELSNLTNLEDLYLSANFTGSINLLSLCSQLYQLGTNQSSNQFISDGNNFDTPWEDFCALTLGTCDCAYLDYTHLRTMYLNSNGDNWTDNTGWLTADEFMANPIMPASLTDLQISNNQFSGCYDINLMSLCTKLDAATDATISDGNNFDTNWEDFCAGQTDACVDCREQDYIGLRALYLSTYGDDWWGYE